MIIKSQINLPIDEVITEGYLTDRNGDLHKIPFKVMEEVTKADYLIQCINEEANTGLMLSTDKYYRISID